MLDIRTILLLFIIFLEYDIKAHDAPSISIEKDVQNVMNRYTSIPKVDSVYQELTQSSNFQDVIRHSQNISLHYYLNNYFVASKEVSEILLQHENQIQSPELNADIHFIIGLSYFATGLYAESIFHHNEARIIAENHGLDSFRQKIITNQAASYRNAGMLDKSLELLNSLPEENAYNTFWKYYHRGYTYYKMGNIENALSDYDFALSIKTEKFDAQYMVHNVVGDLYEEINVDSAIIHYQLAIDKNGYEDGEQKCHALIGLGKAYLNQREYSKAKNYLTEGYEMALRFKFNKHTINAAKLLLSISEIEQDSDAIAKYSQAAIKELEISNQQQTEESIVIKLKDLLELQEEKSRILQQEKEYTEWKHQRNRRIIFFSLGVIGLLGFMMFSYRRLASSRKKKIETINVLSKELEKTNQLLNQSNSKLEHSNLKLEQSNESLRNFASIAAHDLKAPLRTIHSFSGLLSRKIADEPKNVELLDYIMDSTEQMSSLVDDLLVFSRLDKDLPDMREVNLNISLERVMLKLQADINHTDAQFHISGLPNITAHSSLIEMLFQNILSNAIKFRKPNVQPHIHIQSKNSQDNVEIRISDNGIGIKEEYLNEVFLLFRKLHSQSTYKGSGIGLATCKKIVDFYHGNIHIESVYGEGSTFIIRFPKSVGAGTKQMQEVA